MQFRKLQKLLKIMNKTININLGGFPFIIDEAAYSKLDRYLSSIKNHFTTNESYQEIMNDIELRVGEILNDKPQGRLIINEEDIDEVISIMGTPEDFGADSLEEQDLKEDYQDSSSFSASDKQAYKTGKKLFKDPRNKIIAGVCAGLGAYFNINVNLFRILFIILTVSGGLGVPLYVLLWIFLPKPKSASDYLTMTGKNASVSNIADFFEKQFNRFSSEVNDLTDDVKEKFNQKNFRTTASPFINDLEENVKSAWITFKRILKPLLTIIGIIMLALFGLLWICMVIGFIISLPFINFVTSSSPLINFISALNSFIVFIIPLIFLIMWALRILFKTYISATLRQSLFIFWITNLVSLIVLGSLTATEFKTKNTSEVRQTFEFNTNEPILVSTDHKNYGNQITYGIFESGPNESMTVHSSSTVKIFPSESERWYVIKKYSSLGSSQNDARKNIDCIVYDIQSTGNTITLPDYYILKNDCKYRFQNIETELYIPVGASIKFSPDMQWRIGEVKTDPEKMKNGFVFVENRSYTMSKGGLFCSDCTEEDYKKTETIKIETGLDLNDLPNDYVLHTLVSEFATSYNDNKTINISMDKIMAVQSNQEAMKNIKVNIEPGIDNKITSKAVLKYYLNYDLQADYSFYKTIVTGNDIRLSNTYPLMTNNNIKNPSLEVTLQVPVGKNIKLDNSFEEYLGTVKLSTDMNKNDLFDPSNIWQMTQEGLKCLNCE